MDIIRQALGLSPPTPTNLTDYISVALIASTGHNAKATINNGIASFYANKQDKIYSLKVKINPQQAGSGDPSLDNVRPISGWTGATITRTGKNLFDAQTLLSAPGWTEQDGVFIGGSTNLRNFIFFKNDSNYGGQLTISCDYFGSQTYRSGYLQFKYSDGTPNTYVGLTGTEKAHFALTSLEGHQVDEAFFLFSNSVTMRLSNVMLEFGATESGYETYAGKTIPISWETEAGTVYGGTLDVTTGLLTARPYYASYSGEALVGPWISSIDAYTPGATPTTGAQVVDMGGEARTYQLSPQQVNTLLGVNNIRADIGPVIELLY